MNTLLEREQAITRLPKKSQRQLIRDLPDLCASVFPANGWDAILADPSPRPKLSKLLDSLDAEYRENPGKFTVLNEDFLAGQKGVGLYIVHSPNMNPQARFTPRSPS